MKELKEEAKRHHEAKLHKYGASDEERKACGGSMKRAHGGKVEHPHEKKNKQPAKENKHEAEEIEHDHEGKKHGGHVRHHRDMGGPIAGGGGRSKLGRGRKGGKGTNVNVVVPRGGSDGPGAPPMPPPALGAGPSAMPPKPMMPPPGAAGPRPMPPPGAPGLGAKHGEKI